MLKTQLDQGSRAQVCVGEDIFHAYMPAYIPSPLGLTTYAIEFKFLTPSAFKPERTTARD
jgi:hypothetical protein